MLETITSLLADKITSQIEATTYLAVFLFMTLESMFVPIPSEVTMPFAGFLASLGKVNFWLVILVGGTANLLGSLIAYGIGYWGQKRVHEWVRRYGKYLLVSVGEVERSEKWFRNHGELVAFASRLMPIVRTFISLPAGMAKMNVFKFSVYSFAGALIWSTVLTYFGFQLGKNWHSLEIYFRKFQFIIIAVFAILIFLYIYRKLKKVREENS